MNHRPCSLCLLHPQGLEGHEHLRSSNSGLSTRLLFKCERCGSRWLREYDGQGAYVWMDRAAMQDSRPSPDTLSDPGAGAAGATRGTPARKT